jgi:hypothetical protein
MARELTARFAEFSNHHLFARWHRLALCYQQSLDPEHEPVLHAIPAGPLQRELLGTVAEHWVDATTVSRAERGLCGWCTSELLRVAGILLLREGMGGAAESRFQAALQIARDQGLLAYELRSARSLARLWAEQGRKSEARAELGAVFERFEQGHETADLRAARTLLAHM